MSGAQVQHIFISPVARGPMLAADEVKAIAGRGLEGDRYFKGEGTFSPKAGRSGEITLIEMESILAVRVDAKIHLLPSEPRRNLVTCGIRLNDLVGRMFCVGDVVLCGLKLCNPCDHLELLTQTGLKQALANRGGLRAEIVRGGMIRLRDHISVITAEKTQAAAAGHEHATEYGSGGEFRRIISLLSA